MSTATEHQPSVECHYPDCDVVGRKWEFRDGKYCSTECETKHTGYRTLAPIRFDHCVCATCFHDLKTTNPPKPDGAFIESGCGWTRNDEGKIRLETYYQEEARRAAVGYQFLTPRATKGEKQGRTAEGVRDRVITGTICDHCGNTDHTHHDPVLATRAAIGRLAVRLDERDDVVLDVHQLHREYEAVEDLALAVGRGLVD